MTPLRGRPVVAAISLRRFRVAVMATFSAHALVAGTIGPWIPRVKADAGLDAWGLGVALAA